MINGAWKPQFSPGKKVDLPETCVRISAGMGSWGREGELMANRARLCAGGGNSPPKTWAGGAGMELQEEQSGCHSQVPSPAGNLSLLP